MTQQAKDELDNTIRKIFRENQAKLPEEDRTAKNADEMCRQTHDGYGCTKKVGHTGQHIAHGNLGYVIERWD